MNKTIFAYLLVFIVMSSFNMIYAQPERPALRCGDATIGEIVEGQSTAFDIGRFVDEYHLDIRAGTIVDILVKPLGDTFNTGFVLVDSGNNDTLLVNSGIQGETDIVQNLRLGASNLTLRIFGLRKDFQEETPFEFYGYNNNAGRYFGAYEIEIICVDDVSLTPMPQRSIPISPNFGFPGVAPRDFSTGIELPLTLAQPQTAPVGGDVALYTYTAAANETRTLKISRVSGDISIGVSVINKDTNEIVFFGGMPSSNTLSVELTFPSDGTYAIGLFRVDTTQKIGTSGAVQITLE